MTSEHPGWLRRITIPLVALLAGCSSGPRITKTDLLQTPPDGISPTNQILPADETTRQLLLFGFARDADHALVIPSDAERSGFQFEVVAPSDIRIAIRATAPKPFRGSVKINQSPVGEVSIPGGQGEAILSVPASQVQAGINTVTIEYSAAATNARVRAAVESITFGEGVRPVRWARQSPSSLEQSPGSEARWLLRPERDHLEFAGRVSARSDDSGTVEILGESDRFPPRVLWISRFHGAGEHPIGGDVNLTAFVETPVRIVTRFRCSAADASLTWDRLQVTGKPRIVVRPTPPPPTASRPNIVVVLVDSLRPDHLSFYGYSHPTTPELRQFAAESLVFDNAWTPSSWTKPSVASLFTGKYPADHGIRDHHGQLAADFETIAELLKKRGYLTAAVVVNPSVGSGDGLEQGFDRFDFLPGATVDEAVKTALKHTRQQPFFLYLHLMDPHYPYSGAPPPFDALIRRPAGTPIRAERLSIANLRRKHVVPTAAEIDYLRSLYDSKIAFVDHGVTDLVQRLKKRGLFDSTLFVLTSDHGEEFADHDGFYHGHTLFNELIHAVLVVKPAGAFSPRVVHAPAQTIDLFPTIATVVGAPRDGLPGRDLLDPAFNDHPKEAGELPIFGEIDLRAHLRSVVMNGYKLVLEDRHSQGSADSLRLYDITTDPHEQTDLSQRQSVRAELMASALRRHLDGFRSRSHPQLRRELDQNTRRDLKALGYLEADDP